MSSNTFNLVFSQRSNPISSVLLLITAYSYKLATEFIFLFLFLMPL